MKFTGNLIPNLDRAPEKIHGAMSEITRFQTPRVEAYMRGNARWTDRTGNARNGLNAVPEISKNLYAIECGHSMPYGIWLEVRWSGRYAIVDQTIQNQGNEMMALVSRIMSKIT